MVSDAPVQGDSTGAQGSNYQVGTEVITILDHEF